MRRVCQKMVDQLFRCGRNHFAQLVVSGTLTEPEGEGAGRRLEVF